MTSLDNGLQAAYIGRHQVLQEKQAQPGERQETASFAGVLQQIQNQAESSSIAEPGVDSTQASGQSEHNVVDEFMAWMQMTPAEKMRDRILKELGLTEEELESMDPEERDKIEQLIAQKIKDELELQISNKPDFLK